MSSTRAGSKPIRSLTSFNRAYVMYSSEVSLKPPFLPLHSGVRMARVITISSAFFDVLFPPYVRLVYRESAVTAGKAGPGAAFGCHPDDGAGVNLHLRQARARSELLDNGCNAFGGHGFRYVTMENKYRKQKGLAGSRARSRRSGVEGGWPFIRAVGQSI